MPRRIIRSGAPGSAELAEVHGVLENASSNAEDDLEDTYGSSGDTVNMAKSTSPVFALLNVWPTIILAGVSVGAILPLESYISLNFFSQKYTDIDPGSIHCEVTPDEHYCKSAVYDNVAWTSLSSAASSIVHILLGTAIGVFSDAYGRKPVIVVCGVLGLLPTCAQGLFVYFNVTLFFWYAMRLFSYIPVIGVWFALITDLIDNPEIRAVAFGTVLVGFELAVLLGMLVGSRLSLRSAIAMSAMSQILNVVWQVGGLRESLPTAKRKPLKCGPLVPVAGLAILLRNTQLRQLTFIFLMSSFVGAGIVTTSTSYYQKFLSWDASANFVGLMIGQLSILAWVGGALRPLTERFGEVGLLLVSQLAGAVFFMALYFAKSPLQVWVSAGVFRGATSLAFPATAALKGGAVDDTEQGHIQGAVQTVQSVASCLGPMFFGLIFNVSARSDEWTPLSGLIFLLGSLLSCCLLPVIYALPRDIMQHKAASAATAAAGEAAHAKVPQAELDSSCVE